MLHTNLILLSFFCNAMTSNFNYLLPKGSHGSYTSVSTDNKKEAAFSTFSDAGSDTGSSVSKFEGGGTDTKPASTKGNNTSSSNETNSSGGSKESGGSTDDVGVKAGSSSAPEDIGIKAGGGANLGSTGGAEAAGGSNSSSANGTAEGGGGDKEGGKPANEKDGSSDKKKEKGDGKGVEEKDPGTKGTQGYSKNGVEAHNIFRKIHKAPDIKNNEKMAKEAEAYAKELAKSFKFEHSKSKDGENLAMSCSSKKGNELSAADATKMW